MLRELHITNLAVIEDAVLTLGPGLNAFTGQTGAGKSLVLGAVEALLGLRPLAKMVRGGLQEGEEARVDAIFELTAPAQAAALSELLGDSFAPGDELVVSRRSAASGRGGVRVNGKPVATAMLKAAAGWLVDIHGQHDGQRLLRPSEQLTVLDAWADAAPLRGVYGAAWDHLQALVARRTELADGAALRAERLELYGFQAKELDAAKPRAGEYAGLVAREKVLGSVEDLRQDAEAAVAALDESEQGEAVVAQVRKVERLVAGLAETDAQLAALQESVHGALIALQEAAYDLRRYADKLEVDPAELAQTRERLDALNRLVRKYGRGQPGADEMQGVLDHREKIAEEMARLTRAQTDSGTLEADWAAARRDLATAGAQLSAARQKAAVKLGPLIEHALRDLGMAEAKVRVAVDSADPAQVGDGELALAGPSGLDAVSFEVRTNPGQPWAAMREVASGGELSRVMLALKSVVANRQHKAAQKNAAAAGSFGEGALLVFDEVDANIGGRLGDVIGRKLKALSAGGQVLCITHLPQIAAFADHHYRIVKDVSGSGAARTTRTRVEALAGETRVSELADMLAGSRAGETTRLQARELMNQPGA